VKSRLYISEFSLLLQAVLVFVCKSSFSKA